jgi:hypothetical protein
MYSQQYPEKQELIIEIQGYAAKVIGYLLRAKQY